MSEKQAAIKRKAKDVPVPIPMMARAKLIELVTARQAVEEQIQAYISGMRNSLGLEGRWDVSLDTMLFTKAAEQSKNGAEKPTGAE